MQSIAASFAAVEEGEDKVSISGTVISNFALQHLLSARLFRDRCCEIEAAYGADPNTPLIDQLRAYASATIMSATASLEALINEIFITPGYGLRETFKDFDAEFWAHRGLERRPILEKYEHALRLLGARGLNQQSASYKDAEALIELRNALVHFKPSVGQPNQASVTLAGSLHGKFHKSPAATSGCDFVAKQCMSAGCATWTVSTVVAFLREFDHHAAISGGKMHGFWAVEA